MNFRASVRCRYPSFYMPIRPKSGTREHTRGIIRTLPYQISSRLVYIITWSAGWKTVILTKFWTFVDFADQGHIWLPTLEEIYGLRFLANFIAISLSFRPRRAKNLFDHIFNLMVMAPPSDEDTKLNACTTTLCLKKRHCFGLLSLRPASTDFDNFWQECCRESNKSNGTLFFHLT